jgi:hypothetical protein
MMAAMPPGAAARRHVWPRPAAHQPQAGLEIQGAGGGQGAELAQAVACQMATRSRRAPAAAQACQRAMLAV